MAAECKSISSQKATLRQELFTSGEGRSGLQTEVDEAKQLLSLERAALDDHQRELQASMKLMKAMLEQNLGMWKENAETLKVRQELKALLDKP